MAEEQENELSIGADEKVGDYLRRVRESRGLNLEHLAKSIRLSKSIVEAIEENRWSEFRTEAYLRSYIISICEKLFLDKNEVIRKFSAEINSHFAVAQALIDDPNQEKDPSGSAPKIAIVVVLVLIAALFFANKAFNNGPGEKPAPRASVTDESLLEDDSTEDIPDSLAQGEPDEAIADLDTDPDKKDTLRFECSPSATDNTCGVSLKGLDSKMNYFVRMTSRYLDHNDTAQVTVTVPERTRLSINGTKLEYGKFNTLVFHKGKIVNKINRDLR
ncbi:MAG: helix-turn-helix domain-containing protein [Candidatus Fibromonas sp.]|jgi:transcriptional regulator with XRE-family HTH domain|nr:helix-turn-helix domain-containing protein [Candidatus Fibromonas sp.]